MEYSKPYFLLLLFLFFLFLFERLNQFNNNKTRRKLRIVVFLAFVFFFSFSGYIGSDWYNYKISYDLNVWNKLLITDYEIGFAVLVKIFKFFKLDYLYCSVGISIIQFLLFDRFINRSFRSIILPYILLLALFPIVVIDLQRNFLSILIAMNASLYLINGNKKKFFLGVLLAISFHISAVVFLILPLIRVTRFKKSVMWSLLFVGIIIYIMQINFFNNFLLVLGELVGGRLQHLTLHVTNEEEVSYGISIGIIEKIVILILFIKIYNKIPEKYLLFANCCVIYLFIYLYFSTSQSFINRFSNLFMFGYIWFYGYLVFTYRKSNIYGLGMAVLFLFVSLRTLIAYNIEIYSYKNILFEKELLYKRISVREYYYERL